MKNTMFIVTITFMSLFPISGQVVTDVAQKVGTALGAFGPVPVTTVIQKPRQETVWYDEPIITHPLIEGATRRISHVITVYDSVPVTSSLILSAANIQIVKSDPVSFGPSVRTELPDKVIVKDQAVQNCSKVVQLQQQVSLSQSFQRTEGIQFSQSITHTLNKTLSFDFGITSAFKVGGQIMIGESSTSGQVQTAQDSETTQISESGTVTIPTNSALMVELRVWPVHYTIPFRTTVTVDADLSKNDRGYYKLSDILDVTNRTFQITGTIEANDSSDGKLVAYDMPYDPSQCGGTDAPSLIKNFIPKAEAVLREKSNAFK
jgi:hypothetical protein